jgi:hypothetical protein
MVIQDSCVIVATKWVNCSWERTAVARTVLFGWVCRGSGMGCLVAALCTGLICILWRSRFSCALGPIDCCKERYINKGKSSPYIYNLNLVTLFCYVALAYVEDCLYSFSCVIIYYNCQYVCVFMFLESFADGVVNNRPFYFGTVQWNWLWLHLLRTPVLQLLLVYFFICVFC